jgi:hypothetical protein
MKMKQLARRKGLLSWLIAAFVFTGVPTSQAAPEILFDDTLGAGCSAPYTSGALHAQRLIARGTISISSIDAFIGTAVQTNFSSARFYILSDNPSTHVPLAILETFTPTAISGSGAFTIAKFVGSFSANSGTKFWVAAGQIASTFGWCYISGVSAANFTMNGITLDTTTGLSNSNFRRAYISGGTISSGGWVSTNDSLAFLMNLNGTVTPSIVTITSGMQNGGSSVTYRTSSVISSNVSTPSRVTYLANGKYISDCRGLLSSGGTSTCTWRPSVHGAFTITVRATPIDSSIAASSTKFEVSSVARTNKR